MILFFDRNIGTTIPRVLIDLKLPIQVEYHQLHFRMDEQDDVWLKQVGEQGWTVIGHDRYHLKPNELAAIRQHSVGCFYLGGARATKWDKMRIFAAGYDNIIQAEQHTPRPFVYVVERNGRLLPIEID